MEKKKSINLITLILIGVIFIVSFTLGFFLDGSMRNKEENTQISNENFENENESQAEKFIWESENVKGESIELDSNLGKQVSDYFTKAYADPGALYEQILEFNNIENAPKEYLNACVISQTLEELYENSLINNETPSISYEDYNKTLISLFGENANNLIEPNYLDQVFTEKDENGRYELYGYCGPETNYFVNSIKSIEKRGDILYVEMYEYRTDWGENSSNVLDMLLGSKPLEECYDYEEYIYNRSGEVITKIKNKFLLEESQKSEWNSPIFEEYYEDGTKVCESDKTLFEKYSDKLSIRGLELKYNEKDNSLYLLRNKLLTD